jgi:hypothetical protein
MDTNDSALRNLTCGRFAVLGRAPTAAEIAAVVGLDEAEFMTGWERLHAAEYAVVLSPVTTDSRMANPFSGVPTAHRVRAAGRWWSRNCA